MTMRRTLCFLLCLCLIAPMLVHTDAASSSQIRSEIDDLEAQEQEIQDKLDELEAQRKENMTELLEIVEQKNLLDQQISLLNQQILNIQEQLRVMKLLIADQQDVCDQAAADYARLNEQYKERIRAMEEGGSLTYWSVLFRANSLADFLDRLNMIQEIAQADRTRMERLTEAAQKVEEEKQVLLSQESDLQATAEELAESQLLLADKRAESEALMRQLAAKDAEFEALIDESEAAQQELLEEIAKKEDEFDKAKYQEWLAAQPPARPSTGGGSTSTPTTGTTGWVTPVPYYVLTSPFGMRLHPVHGDYRMHNGIDMACAEGTPIYAAKGGQVEIATYSSSAGYYVQINHGDGYRSVYMHMTHYIVGYGQYVSAGQIIGYVGSTGTSTGNHLHFGISYYGQYINPLPLIS